MNKIIPIAFYLPQYHPIPENDKWWGKGFTEWTNVIKAVPLFEGHDQPVIPGDLGYYDLRNPATRELQAKIAHDYGIYGFCYYHYWFGNGKQLLERPFNEVLDSKKPDFPFCLCWANETWKGIWFGGSNEPLIEQTYPGREDYELHFAYLVNAFRDTRYIKIDGKPLFVVYMPLNIPDLKEFTETFRELALKAGLNGLYLLACRCPEGWNPTENNFDGVIGSEFSSMRYLAENLFKKVNIFTKIGRATYLFLKGQWPYDVEQRSKPLVVEYSTAIKYLLSEKEYEYDYFPCVIPNWDNTPRAGKKGLVLKNSTPQLFYEHFSRAIQKVQHRPDGKRVIFIKSWNEWAESNYLEPDEKYGYQYLEVIKQLVSDFK